MHGVYVNGLKITRTPISERDIIAFGNKVTRAEGEYLSSGQALNFSEYPFLTSFPATHDGVSLTVGRIVREGAIFSNPIDLTQPTKNTPPAISYKPVPQTSYGYPDYDTDSSKENNTNTTLGKPTPVPFIDLEPVSSPAPSDNLDHSEDEDEDYRGVYYNDFQSDSELGSDEEVNDYPENEDDFEDDEQSCSGSDRSGSPCSAVAHEEDDTQRDEVGSQADYSLKPHEDNQAAPIHVNDAELVQPKAIYPQDEEKEKTRDVAQRMSLSYFLEPANPWDIPTMPLAPSAVTPSCCGPRDVESLPVQSKKNDVEGEGIGQARDQIIESQETSLDGRHIDRELEDLGLKDQVAASQSKVNEPVLQSSSSTGDKRKREIEDDGHEEIPAPAPERKLLRLKFDQQQILRDLFKRDAQTAPRPTKRVKRSTARFALGAVAGAIGGVATVVGVLMTPACEELLSSWPIA